MSQIMHPDNAAWDFVCCTSEIPYPTVGHPSTCPDCKSTFELRPQICEWFTMCQKPATQTRPHPVLGDVAICDDCQVKMNGLDQ